MSESKGTFFLIVYRSNKSTILVIIPLLLISLIAGIVYSSSETLFYLFSSSDEEYSFQILDGLILVFITILSAFLLVLAIRKNLVKLLKIIYSIIFLVSSVSIFWVHGYLLELSFSLQSLWLEIIFAIVGLIVGILTIYVIILEKTKPLLKNTLVFTLGLVMGIVFGTVFPLVSFLSLLVFVSLFDIYSVFRGPISKLLKKINLSLSLDETVFQKPSIAIGIGDFVFYSSLVTFTTKELGLIFGFIAIVGILIGIKMTENMLQRYGKFPGLPIPIFLSLFLLLIGWGVSTYLAPI